MKNSNFLKNLKWIFYVSRRFSKVDKKGRSRITSMLASLGICFGVMTLIIVISVMNGFQLSFIDPIVEISSYHIRAEIPQEKMFEFSQWCENEKSIVCATPFYEAQSLMVGRNGRQSAAMIRAVPKNMEELDKGFMAELDLWNDQFLIKETNQILLGADLARTLGVNVGGSVNLFALSGGNDVDLISNDREFLVTGVFRTGYAGINQAFAFVNLEAGEKNFGEKAVLNYGIKITDSQKDEFTLNKIKTAFPDIKVQGWRDYNRSFFGALRVEKNVLMLMVFLIFVVVAINIFNGMRRMVNERREEISILSALGGTSRSIQSIFIMQGFLTGLKGAIPGLVFGLLISVKMPQVFQFLSNLVYYLNYFAAKIINPAMADNIRFNSTFLIYSRIPPRIIFSEILVITIFGIFSALFASWWASRGVLKMTVAEVLRDE